MEVLVDHTGSACKSIKTLICIDVTLITRLSPAQFLITYSCKNREEGFRPWSAMTSGRQKVDRRRSVPDRCNSQTLC